MGSGERLLSPFSPEGSVDSPTNPEALRSYSLSPSLSRPRRARLPRDGPSPGRGQLQVFNRSIIDEHIRSDSPESPSALGSPGRRPSLGSKGNRSASSKSLSKALSSSKSLSKIDGRARTDSESPRSSARDGSPVKERGQKHRVTPEERRKMEIYAKWEKTEVARERDKKDVMERVERNQQWRDERFKRLMDAVTAEDGLAYNLALAMREREAREEKRRRDLHNEWVEKVWQPLAIQAHGRMNPPNRAMHQLMVGEKSVSFSLPDEHFSLVAKVREDPTKKLVVDAAKENAFHQVANSVLGHSRSAPELTALGAPARSRPVLEPSTWGQQAIQGTIFGHFAQMCENGPGMRSRRGGSGVHVPDEADNVLAAGTRKHPDGSYHDKGILKGEVGTLGESSQCKTGLGCSSAAPNQDHYNFETGTRITSLEFPPGKKMNPNFH